MSVRAKDAKGNLVMLTTPEVTPNRNREVNEDGNSNGASPGSPNRNGKSEDQLADELSILRAENLEVKQYALRLESQLQLMLIREAEAADELELAKADHEAEMMVLREDVDLLRRQLMVLDAQRSTSSRSPSIISSPGIPAAGGPGAANLSAIEVLAKNTIEENNALRKVLWNKQKVLAELANLPPSERAKVDVRELEERYGDATPQDRPSTPSGLVSPNSAEAADPIRNVLVEQQVDEYRAVTQQLYDLLCEMHAAFETLTKNYKTPENWADHWQRCSEIFDRLGLDTPTFECIVKLEPFPDPTRDQATEAIPAVEAASTSPLRVEAVRGKYFDAAATELSSEDDDEGPPTARPPIEVRKRTTAQQVPPITNDRDTSTGYRGVTYSQLPPRSPRRDYEPATTPVRDEHSRTQGPPERTPPPKRPSPSTSPRRSPHRARSASNEAIDAVDSRFPVSEKTQRILDELQRVREGRIESRGSRRELSLALMSFGPVEKHKPFPKPKRSASRQATGSRSNSRAVSPAKPIRRSSSTIKRQTFAEHVAPVQEVAKVKPPFR